MIAPPSAFPDGDCRLRRGDDRADVQIEDLVDQLVRELLERRALDERAGVVDQHIQATERLHGRLDDALRLAPLREVAFNEMAIRRRRGSPRRPPRPRCRSH